MLLGVGLFNATFAWIEPLYSATPMGAIRLTDLAGVAPGAGIAGLTAVALAGFVVAGRIERGRR